MPLCRNLWRHRAVLPATAWHLVTSNVQCVHLAAGDALKPATPLTNGAINETLRQFAPLSDDRLLQLVGCCESSTLIDYPLKGTPNSVIDWIQ